MSTQDGVAVAPDARERELWEAWRSHGDEKAREVLLEKHLPYARVVAASYYARRKHDEIEFDDYFQLASSALVEAAGRFDPARGVQFRTFAAHRMHGEILDGIERMTEKQQQIAARQRMLEERRAIIAASSPVMGGKAASGDRLLDFVAEAGIAFALGWLLEGTGMVRMGDDAYTVPFYASMEVKLVAQRIASLIDSLPAQEHKVIRAHYLHQRPFEEIALELNLSRGRISQIHRRGLTRLRELMPPAGLLECG